MTHQDPHSHPADPEHEPHPIPAQDARQGRNGRRLLTVLIVSLAAAALLLLGWWAMNNNNLQKTADANSATPHPVEVAPADGAMPAAPDATPPPVQTDRP
ncbi:hypothetical protein [Brevundimonas diminuta]|uniref:hypothetical protein n=1 Tax=Brevundimonas diminuta TaxID=293 RepID=UPI003D03F297